MTGSAPAAHIPAAPAPAAPTDSGHTDSGHTDSGHTDSGRTDSGRIDSGRIDSGCIGSGHTDSGRIERNRAALAARFPDLGPALNGPVAALPVHGEDAAVIDLDLGQNRLYGSDGRTLAADQVAGYMEKPLRFFITDLSGANIASDSSFRLFRRLQDELEGRGIGINDLNAKPQYEGCFLIVLGLGLGFHLQELIDRTGAKVVLIVEPHAEFLRHSLASLDWTGFIAANEERGCRISIEVPSSAADALRRISVHFTDYGSHFIDGAYVFVHYPSVTLFDIRDRLVESVQVLYSSRGYHEDELVMLTNSAANLALGNFRWLDGKLRPERSEPVFIIGSGPSIDKSIEHIKRLRDRAIVFSCGTGLRVCLGNGIVPDFHCEIENGPQVHQVLSIVRSQFDFKGMTLIAPFSVDPRVPPLFDDAILFFRDAVSGSRVFADHADEIYLAVPTVTNCALRSALAMGFGTCYLFGVDCGTKDTSRQHSRQSVYFHADMFKAEPRTDMTYTFQGNFGGLVKSNWILMFTRMMIAEVCRVYQPKVFNCSDGAGIRGTTPKIPEAVKLPELARGRQEIKDAVRGRLRFCGPKDLLAEISFDHLKAEVERFRAGGLAAIAAAAADDEKNFIGFWRHLDRFFRERADDYAQIPSLIDCSLKSLPKIGMFLIHRLPDKTVRQELYDVFLDEYRSVFLQMCDTVNGCLDKLVAEYGL